jgi:hypothetical protein
MRATPLAVQMARVLTCFGIPAGVSGGPAVCLPWFLVSEEKSSGIVQYTSEAIHACEYLICSCTLLVDTARTENVLYPSDTRVTV